MNPQFLEQVGCLDLKPPHPMGVLPRLLRRLHISATVSPGTRSGKVGRGGLLQRIRGGCGLVDEELIQGAVQQPPVEFG